MVATLLAGIPGTAAAQQPQTAPATQPALIKPSDAKALGSHVGQDVAVEGVVSDAAWSASGKVFLIKFKDGDESQFQGALFLKVRETMEKAFGGDLSDAFEGATIRISGKLQTYRDHPEILVGDPKQITILAKGPGHSPHAAPSTRAS